MIQETKPMFDNTIVVRRVVPEPVLKEKYIKPKEGFEIIDTTLVEEQEEDNLDFLKKDNTRKYTKRSK